MRQSALQLVANRDCAPKRARRGLRGGVVSPGNADALGRLLVESGALQPGDLAKAHALMLREEARFEDILLHNLMVDEMALYGAMARLHGVRLADLAAEPPDPRLIDEIGVKRCIAEGLVPWKRVGGAVVYATARPEEFARLRESLPPAHGPALMAVAPLRAIQDAVMEARAGRLAQMAETRVPPTESSRVWNRQRLRRAALAGGLIGAAILLISPLALMALLTAFVVLSLTLSMGLKFTAALVQWRAMRRRKGPFQSPRERPAIPRRLPTVSILVPLFREREIAAHLIRRLQRLNYPRELLDVLLVVEADDALTRETLARTALPRWMRVITVAEGSLRTKPRALNYALDFCRGSVIGVYDAEDAPHPDQIHEIVRRFHARGPEVACLQGILDFYNSRHNWLARCFTIEYASWFRIVLPGIERLGLALPLGGTTIFFRREALEEIGGWDAHNVTEDADLGFRLARHGYRTEVVPTATHEEANARALPWIRQRSRWLKGFAITWAVHMKTPRRTLRELGGRRFFGFQMLMLGTFSQFLLAPLLWSFWVIPLGLAHPLAALMPGWGVATLGGLFLACESITVAIGLLAVSGPAHRHLLPFVPTLHFYYPLATLAAWKAAWEIVTRPFYWDKTSHGHFTARKGKRRFALLRVGGRMTRRAAGRAGKHGPIAKGGRADEEEKENGKAETFRRCGPAPASPPASQSS